MTTILTLLLTLLPPTQSADRAPAPTLPSTRPATTQPTTQNALRRVHVIVTGRVQGVGFRAFTQQHATELHLTGYVLNRDDGSVEAVIQGPAQDVARLVKLINRGPASARVDNLRLTDQPPTGDLNDFEIRYELPKPK